MYTDFLKQLFIELFQVNHLMLDLIDSLENTDFGDEFLTEFYIKNITKEFDRSDLSEHKENNSCSCLWKLNTEELDALLSELF